MSTHYTLPKLPFGLEDLAPQMSADQLKIHYEKHHQAYVNNTNALLDKIKEARAKNEKYDVNGVLKSLSFNLGGFILHSLFWENLISSTSASAPTGEIEKVLVAEFGSLDRFKQEFTQAAMGVEGAGWAALARSIDGNLFIMQIEKHNVNLYPSATILLVLDMFEHAYYLDYKNDKAKYVEAFWQIVNWSVVGERLGS